MNIKQTTKEALHARKPVYAVQLAICGPRSYLFSYLPSLHVSMDKAVCMY